MSNKPRQHAPVEYATGAKNPDIKPVLRWSLTLSSLAMLAFAGLSFAHVLPFPPLIGYLFVAIALVDLVIAYVVFGK